MVDYICLLFGFQLLGLFITLELVFADADQPILSLSGTDLTFDEKLQVISRHYRFFCTPSCNVCVIFNFPVQLPTSAVPAVPVSVSVPGKMNCLESRKYVYLPIFSSLGSDILFPNDKILV